MSKAVIKTDAIIVGAGPVGLFAVFELGLLGIKCHVLDILGRPGGQCAELYPEKPIYDIPGHVVITGRELTENLLAQIKPFEPVFHFNMMVQSLSRAGDDGWRIGTDDGLQIEARVVVIACGGGCFQPKRPRIDGIEAFEGKSVFYSIREIEAFSAKNVLIAGGGDSALDWLFALSGVAGSLTLVHRRREFRASPDSVARMEQMVADGSLDFHLGQILALHGADGRLEGVGVKGPDGDCEIACDVLLPFFGLSVRLGPLAEWGLNMDCNLIPVDPGTFATAQPGIFAIGDIISYPGKLKLILSGFHEAALMAHAAYRVIHPGERLVFQHTTSSSRLQRRLGVVK